MDTQWILIEDYEPSQLSSFAQKLRVPQVIAKILLNRGICNYENAKVFFRPDINQLHNPFDMRDMDVAVDRLVAAIKQQEKIVIYGDYDVDGTTSVALLLLFLKQFGLQPLFYIPNRIKDGYGLSDEGIREIHQWNADLIITTDCGITAFDEVELANNLGIDVIVSDHHEPSEILPKAIAVLNPKRKDCDYPFKELAGVGVAYKLIQGACEKMQLDQKMSTQFLDLVAIGSTADIVPLLSENRILVNAGLEQLNRDPKMGIRAILLSSRVLSRTINTGQILFTIAPRINAVGRMGSADRAVDLLTAESQARANEIAAVLENENQNRRNIDEDTFQEALVLLKDQYNPDIDKVIVLAKDDWHPGVIGIVASKIVERFYRPTVMISLKNGTGKGSARSIQGFDIFQAIKTCEKLVSAYGGHKYAAGLSIKSENIPQLKSQLNKYAVNVMDEKILIPKIRIDSELNLNDIDGKFVRILNLFAPFGPQNIRPVFMSSNLQVVGLPQIVGNNHLKFKVRQNGVVIEAIGFNLGDLIYRLDPGEKNLDMVYSIDENLYKGKKTLQLRVKDLR